MEVGLGHTDAPQYPEIPIHIDPPSLKHESSWKPIQKS